MQVCNNSTAARVVTSVMVTGGAANFEVVTTDPLPKTIQPRRMPLGHNPV